MTTLRQRRVISKPVIGIRYADVLLWYAEALNELGASTYQIPSWDGTQSYDISRDKNEMSYAISEFVFVEEFPILDQMFMRMLMSSASI